MSIPGMQPVWLEKDSPPLTRSQNQALTCCKTFKKTPLIQPAWIILPLPAALRGTKWITYCFSFVSLLADKNFTPNSQQNMSVMRTCGSHINIYYCFPQSASSF